MIVEDFRQCQCWSKEKHDLHCWICQAPLIVKNSREAFITDKGHSATFCDDPECQKSADRRDREYGIPEVEVLRRLTNGIRKISCIELKEKLPRDYEEMEQMGMRNYFQKVGWELCLTGARSRLEVCIQSGLVHTPAWSQAAKEVYDLECVGLEKGWIEKRSVHIEA